MCIFVMAVRNRSKGRCKKTAKRPGKDLGCDLSKQEEEFIIIRDDIK